MSLFLSRLARYAARRIAADPRTRDAALRTARSVAAEAKQVVRDEDPARAAGRAVRRVFNTWQNSGEGAQQGQQTLRQEPQERLQGPRESEPRS